MFRSLLSLAVVCCLAHSVAVAAERPFTIESVRVGIEGCYKNGLWTPITVEWKSPVLENDRSTFFAIRCSDSDGTPITYRYGITGEKTKDGKKITLLAKLGRKDEPIQIQITANSDEFQSFPVPPPVNAERPIYLIFGNDDIGLQGAVAELALREERRPLLVKVNSFADLPDKWFGYEAVEMVVLTTTEPKLFEGLTAESPQIQALNDWLKLGGKMLLCAGKDAGQFLDPLSQRERVRERGESGDGTKSPHPSHLPEGEGANGFLNLFLPGKFDGMAELRSGTQLELFVNSKRQIVMNGTDDAPFMKMPRLKPDKETEPKEPGTERSAVPGITFVKDGDVPLVLRCAHGLGTIIYFGGDLSEKPLKNWRDRSALVRNIMQWNTEKRSGVDPRAGAMLQLGYNDISGQIRSALDQFEGVRIVPFSVILIILTAYWLVIGLFDWFFVHKVLNRPILTWVTFPLWIVLFSVLTYVLAAPGRPAGDNDSHTITNTLLICDVDYETDTKRVSMWDCWYSLGDRYISHYGFSRPDIPDSERDQSGYFSWNGLPGSGLGGMAPKTVSPAVWQVGSEQIASNKIMRVPIQTRSTKSFFGQSNAFDSGFRPQNYRVHTRLSDEEGIPIGTIEVPDDFQGYLKNCILVYGRWFLELGDIEPGQTITITKANSVNMRHDLRDLLIPPKMRESGKQNGLAAYNPQSTDLEYIVRVMSLHRALGGYESTGLHCAYMPSLDMSDLLTADRALLLGVVPTDVLKGEVLYDTTIFRQSLPIALTESSPRLGGRRYEPTGGALDSPINTDYIKDPGGTPK